MPEIGPRYFVSAALAVSATVLSILSVVTIANSRTDKTIPTPLRNLTLEFLIAAIVVINMVMAFVSLLLPCTRRLEELVRRCELLLPFGFCLLVLLLVVNVQALRYEGHIESHPDEFRAKFNKFICDLRVSEVCAAGDNFDKVLVAVPSAVDPTSRVQASTRARDYCSLKFLHGVDSWNVLDAFIVTPAVDKWCGSYALGLPTNTTSPASPVSMNLAKYQSMVTKPIKCVRSVSIVVGSMLVCVALLGFVELYAEKK